MFAFSKDYRSEDQGREEHVIDALDIWNVTLACVFGSIMLLPLMTFVTWALKDQVTVSDSGEIVVK